MIPPRERATRTGPVAGDVDSRGEGADTIPCPLRPAHDAKRYVRFTLGDTDYGISLGAVLETGRPPLITPVPNVPDWVVGVANVRPATSCR